eukprot:168587_1
MENFRMLCSAPNWYQSSLCDCSSNGIVAIGTHHWITLLLVTPSAPYSTNDHLFIGELLGHKDRVQCCKFSFFPSNILAPHKSTTPSKTEQSFVELLVTASSDCCIRIWNVETKQCILLLKPDYNMNSSTFHKTSKKKAFAFNHNINHKCHSYPITAIAVTNSQYTKQKLMQMHEHEPLHTLIISGDSKGYVMCWNPVTNHRIQKRVSDTMVMILEVCPMTTDSTDQTHLEMVGIGYKSGAVLLLGVNEHKINELCRFMGHDAEIQSLSWCRKYVQIEEELKTDDTILDYLPNVFATASKDKYVRFWNTLSGECLFEIQIESKKHASSKQRNWYSLLWISPFKLFVTDSNGRIWSINLKELGTISSDQDTPRNAIKSISLHHKNKDIFTTFEEGHSRCIFGVIPIQNRPQHVLSISLDRNIMYWDINTLKCVWTVRCLGGYVYDLDIALWNPSFLAVAVGDKMIRSWTVSDQKNESNAAQDAYSLNPFYNLNRFEHERNKRKGKYRHKKRHAISHNDPYNCKVIWRGLKDKITAIKWHPIDIGWLVYGTDKGCVGCLDINSESSGGHVRLLTYHNSDIIQVDWKIIAMQYRLDYNTSCEDTLVSSQNQSQNQGKKKKKHNRKARHQKPSNAESGFRVYSLSKDGNIFEGDGWKPNAPSININKYILAANDNAKDMLRTSSDKDIVWTCFCMEVINPFDVHKYKEAVHKMKSKEHVASDVDCNQFSGQKMIIGTNNGCIYVLNGDWKVLCVLNDYNALISCIELNPFHNVSHAMGDSPCNHMMAVGTVDGYILLYALSDVTKDGIHCQMIHKAKHSPKHKSVIKVKWNPFDPNVIASVSIDKRYPLIVWNLSTLHSNGKTKRVLVMESDMAKHPHSSWFTSYHHARHLSIQWSHTDPFVLYTASEDHTCRQLNIKHILLSTNPDTNVENIKYNELKTITFHGSVPSQPVAITVKIQSKSNKEVDTKERVQPSACHRGKHHKLFKSLDAQKLETSVLSLWTLIRHFTNPLMGKQAEIELEPMDALFVYNTDPIHKDQISHWMSSILQNQDSALYPMQLLPSMAYQMQHVMQNDSQSMIEKEVNKFNSNTADMDVALPSLLSLLMSPSLGRQQWMNTMLRLCEYYKHPKIKLYHNAAAIYLSLGSPVYVIDCINLYCDIHCYVEALIIARFHLLPSHPIIKKILCLYAEKCLSKKNYMMAVRCYLSTLSTHHARKSNTYAMQFMEVMKQYVLGILVKHYFAHTFQMEFNLFLSKKKVNKRRITDNDMRLLRLLYDIIHLLYDIFKDKYNVQIDDFLVDAIGKQTVDDIFGMHWMLHLCLYYHSPDMKRMNAWPFLQHTELGLWRLLFRFVSLFEMDPHGERGEIDLEGDSDVLDAKHISDAYLKLRFSDRINHIYRNYSVPNSNHSQLNRMHCVQFANYLLQCFVYHKRNSKDDLVKFESIVLESLNYASTYNTLRLLHQYLRYLLSFWNQSNALLTSDWLVVTQYILDTLELLSSDGIQINVIQNTIQLFSTKCSKGDIMTSLNICNSIIIARKCLNSIVESVTS